jgi:hypothetical protein
VIGDWCYGHFERGPGPDRSRPTHAFWGESLTGALGQTKKQRPLDHQRIQRKDRLCNQPSNQATKQHLVNSVPLSIS